MPTIEDAIMRVRDLPSLPAVVAELLSSMEQDDIDTHVLAAKITLDQSLTAKTLRLANSSFYGMQSKVTTIQQAISVLGFHSIRTLVTACSVTASFAPDRASKFDLQGFWRHSVATAVCAKVLAPHLRLNPDTAFTAGLLHDLGTLVLATRYPEQYRDMAAYQRQHDCYLIDAERAVFGFDHAAVGSALAAHWKFPLKIQEAVAGHHLPPTAAGPTFALAVYLANTIAHGLDLSGQEDDLAPAMSAESWRALALSDAACLAVFGETEQMYRDMCQILVN